MPLTGADTVALAKAVQSIGLWYSLSVPQNERLVMFAQVTRRRAAEVPCQLAWCCQACRRFCSGRVQLWTHTLSLLPGCRLDRSSNRS